MVLLAAGTSGTSALERNTGIWQLLRAAHFPGPMDEWAHARPVKGAILANGKRYSFWEYDALNKESHHGRSGLLVFEGYGRDLSYLGMYNVALDDFRGPVHPVIRGMSVFFPLSHLRNPRHETGFFNFVREWSAGEDWDPRASTLSVVKTYID